MLNSKMKSCTGFLLTVGLLCIIVSVSPLPVKSQENVLESSPRHYSIDGDEVTFDVDDQHNATFHATGNVMLTFDVGDNLWVLEAEVVEFSGKLDEDDNLVPYYAHAQGDINLTGPAIILTAPGSIDIDITALSDSSDSTDFDITALSVTSDSTDIHVIFADGELITDSLELKEILGNNVSQTIVDTDIRTVATLRLTETTMAEDNGASEGNIFASLIFDFADITVETVRTQFILIDHQAVSLDCPDPTIVRTDQSTLTMPSAYITFDPDTLEGPDGVDLLVGQDTHVKAAYLYLEYPPEGGMNIEFIGCPPGILPPDDPEQPFLVTITNPAGAFSAGIINITVNLDGTLKINAIGRACFEIPVGNLKDSNTSEE